MSRALPTAELRQMVVEHSMEVMIDLMAEIEAGDRIEGHARRALEAYTRILLKRAVEYVAGDDEQQCDELVNRLLLDERFQVQQLDPPARRIIEAHWTLLADVETLPPDTPVDLPAWLRVRRSFNHVVDAFRSNTDHNWEFVDAYATGANPEAMAS